MTQPRFFHDSQALPADFSIWVDPGEVAVRIGDSGRIFTLDPSNASQWSDSDSNTSESDDGLTSLQRNRALNPSSKVFKMGEH